MSLNSPAFPGTGVHRSIWSYLKAPALLFIVWANVVFFAGNAALDLWQVFGPATHFTGVVTGHNVILPTGEDADQVNLLTIQSDRGQLQLNVFDKTYADTQVGQHVTGEMDARGLLGHDEGLRELTADGHEVFTTQSFPRVVGQAFIFIVMLAIGVFATRLILRYARPRRDDEPFSPAVPLPSS